MARPHHFFRLAQMTELTAANRFARCGPSLLRFDHGDAFGAVCDMGFSQ